MAKRQRKNSGEKIDLNDAMRSVRQWYYGEVREYAEDYDKQLEEHEFDSSEAFFEQLDQDLDGSQMVIYTLNSKVCLLASDNEDAYVEEFGELPTERGGELNIAAMAMYAFRADILEAMQNDPNDDEWYEEEDEDD